jgi:hypothetical protein
MKKIIILVVLVSLSGCRMLNFIDMAMYSFLDDVEYYDFAEYDLSEVHNFKQIGDMNRRLITYKSDIGEQIDSPRVAVMRGFGDCDEFSLIFMCIAKEALGIKMSLVIVDTTDYVLSNGTTGRTVVNGGIGNHLTVRYNNVNYSAQHGSVSIYQNVLYEYTFDEVFGF